MGNADVIRIDAARSAAGRMRCRATTAAGRPCRNLATGPDGYCARHGGKRAAGREPQGVSQGFLQRAEEAVSRRLAGDYAIDDFGYDDDLTRSVLLPIAGLLHNHYFRTTCTGIENVPTTGPALVVANHSGTIPLDAVMLQYAIATRHPARRMLRCVAANLAVRSPFIGPLARKSGNAVACDEDAFELLRRGELVGVFPEGFKGVGKGWRERYRLQRFGRGGFIEVALRANVPIVPVAVVGAEEAYPMIANIKPLAHLFGFPYFPITPTFPLLGPLGVLPLPSKWIIEFGPTIDLSEHSPEAADDAMLVFDLSDRVRDVIQQMLRENLKRRESAWR